MTYEERIKRSESIAEQLEKRIRNVRRWRVLLLIFGASIIGLMLSLYLIDDFRKFIHQDFKSEFSLALAPLGGFLLLSGLALNEDALSFRRAKALSDVSNYRALQAHSSADQYVEVLAQAVLGNIAQYYQFVLNNVQRSSKLTVSMMTFGFLLMGSGVGVGILSPSEKMISYLSGGSGVLLEMITAALLVFNRESVSLLNSYMSKLESFSDTLLALTLIDSQQDKTKQSQMRENWFNYLIKLRQSFQDHAASNNTYRTSEVTLSGKT